MRVLLTLILLMAISAAPAGAAVGTWWNGFATNSVTGPAFDLLVDGDQLIVAGSFGQAGNHEIQNIAAFNGQLYLAGDFGVVDGVLSRSLARWFPPLAVDAPPSADRRELRLSAAPNPFNPQTVLHYELRGVGEARLDIYDMAGRRVGGVDLRNRGEGPGSWTWNGRDTAGNGLASGVYFVRLREGMQEQRLRVTLLK